MIQIANIIIEVSIETSLVREPHLSGPWVHRGFEDGDDAADGHGQLGVATALQREISVLATGEPRESHDGPWYAWYLVISATLHDWWDMMGYHGWSWDDGMDDYGPYDQWWVGSTQLEACWRDLTSLHPTVTPPLSDHGCRVVWEDDTY